jgi:hypothetical protein
MQVGVHHVFATLIFLEYKEDARNEGEGLVWKAVLKDSPLRTTLVELCLLQ